MRDLFVKLYQKAASLLVGTGISQVYPFNRIEKAFLARFRANTAHVDGHVFHLDPSDSLNLSVYGKHEPFETATLKTLVKPGDVVVDVGANIGYYTLVLARAVGTDGRVFAFEPNPANFALLEKNIAENGYANVTAESAAVSNTGGSVQLFLSPENHVDHRLYDAGDARDAVDVRCVSLDERFGDFERPVSLIKLDIQGAEVKALEGMRLLLDRNPQVRIVTEFWPWGLVKAGAAPDAYLLALKGHGFRFFELDEVNEQRIPVEVEELLNRYPSDNERFTNLLCERS